MLLIHVYRDDELKMSTDRNNWYKII